MKISLKNIGLLKSADFEVNDLTIICGENNTGKTYATYAFYGFLSEWRSLLGYFKDSHLEKYVNVLDKAEIEKLYNNRKLTLAIPTFKQKMLLMFESFTNEYVEKLPSILASNQNFKNSKFEFDITDDDMETILRALEIDNTTMVLNDYIIKVKRDAGHIEFHLPLEFNKDDEYKENYLEAIKLLLKYSLIDRIIRKLIPSTFIVTAERTGASIFRDELNINRAKFLDELRDLQAERFMEWRNKTLQQQSRYPLPIKDSLNFINDLQFIARRDSYIAKKHADILQDFTEIIGGTYIVNEAGIYFAPKGKKTRLTMAESSSSVRSMIHLSFYLRHVAEKGDILIIDEPELNLHPSNQRKISRLFARLVNAGIKVFITTHSDYIIRELNTLIALKQNKKAIKKVKKEYGYKGNELLNAKQINVYIAENNKLVPAEITQEGGIDVNSFDDAIEDMNKIQDDILFGSDDE